MPLLTYTGSVQQITVPTGTVEMLVKLRGAGGGGGQGGNNHKGGGGGTVIATLAVNGGETLDFYVGGKGVAGASIRHGSNGGASSAVVRAGTPLAIAPGGGGASGWGKGGAGGGSTGTQGGKLNGATGGGGGGTQSAAGAAGVGGRMTGYAGSGYNGGDGSQTNGWPAAAAWGHGNGGRGGYHPGDQGGGGGGGGYYGGGGGGNDAAGDGGGGGSALTPAGGNTYAATDDVVYSDADLAGYGNGGAAATDGQNGAIYYEFLAPPSLITIDLSISGTGWQAVGVVGAFTIGLTAEGSGTHTNDAPGPTDPLDVGHRLGRWYPLQDAPFTPDSLAVSLVLNRKILPTIVADAAFSVLALLDAQAVRGATGDAAFSVGVVVDAQAQFLGLVQGTSEFTVTITADVAAQVTHGVAGAGLSTVYITATPDISGSHGRGGTAAVGVIVGVAAEAFVVPVASVDCPLVIGVGVTGQHRDLGFDILRRRHTGFLAPWGASQKLQPEKAARWGAAVRTDPRTVARWGVAARRDAERRYPWNTPVQRDNDKRMPWGRYEKRLQREQRYPWGLSLRADDDLHAPWGRYERQVQPEQRYPWGVAQGADNDLRAPWGVYIKLQREQRYPWGESRRLQWEQYIPWTRYSRTLNPGWGVVTPNNPGQTPGETVTVPIRSIYIVQNTLLLLRLDNNATIPASSMTLSLDYQSWVWAFSAQLPRTALPLLQPNVNGDPVIVEAQINGIGFRFVVERMQRERTFNQETIRIAGRGVQALLDAPYTPVFTWENTQSRTAQQLVGDALSFNNVPLGYTVNWQVTDWLVPAGLWSVRGSHIDGVLAVVNAIGGYIRPDPALDEFTVLNKYPIAPWDWGSMVPDFVLPSAVTVQEGIEWVKRPDYNAVYVSGTTAGPLALVRRTGSAADTFAEMVSDALITATDAARQRGLSILGDSGRKAFVSLQLPVLDETAVIEPGRIVDYTDGAVTRRGLVRGVQVDARSTVDVRQTLTVETNA